MHNLRGYLLLLALPLMVMSCGRSGEGAEHVVAIEPSSDTLVLSEIFRKADVVDITGCLVSSVANAVKIGDGFVLSGNFYIGNQQDRTECEIALFSADGELVRPIALKGRAGNEVLNVQSVKYNPYRKTLDALSDYGRCIVSYDTSTWEVSCKEDLTATDILVAADFVPLDEHKYLCYKNLGYSDDEEYKLYLYDSDSSAVTAHYLVLDKDKAEVISFNQKNNLSSDSGRILFYECFMNTVYSFEDGGLSPYIIFKDNMFLMPESSTEGFSDLTEFLDMCKNSGKIWGHLNFYFAGDRVFSLFEYDKSVFLNVMNLSDDTSASYKYVHDDMISGEVFLVKERMPKYVGVTGDSLLLSVDAAEDHINPLLLVLSW